MNIFHHIANEEYPENSLGAYAKKTYDFKAMGDFWDQKAQDTIEANRQFLNDPFGARAKREAIQSPPESASPVKE